MQETRVWSLHRGRSSGGGNGNPLQYSCLGNPTDRGAWQAMVHGVTKSQLSDWARMHACQLWHRRGLKGEGEIIQVLARDKGIKILKRNSETEVAQSCPTLCNPIDGSPPGSSVPGILQARTWSRLPFPSPMGESEKWKWSRSVMSDSLRPHGLQPTKLLCPWEFPGKSSGVGCHCLLRIEVLTTSNSPKTWLQQEWTIKWCSINVSFYHWWMCIILITSHCFRYKIHLWFQRSDHMYFSGSVCQIFMRNLSNS